MEGNALKYQQWLLLAVFMEKIFILVFVPSFSLNSLQWLYIMYY